MRIKSGFSQDFLLNAFAPSSNAKEMDKF
jgi:hypothetical protein